MILPQKGNSFYKVKIKSYNFSHNKFNFYNFHKIYIKKNEQKNH